MLRPIRRRDAQQSHSFPRSNCRAGFGSVTSAVSSAKDKTEGVASCTNRIASYRSGFNWRPNPRFVMLQNSRSATDRSKPGTAMENGLPTHILKTARQGLCLALSLFFFLPMLAIQPVVAAPDLPVHDEREESPNKDSSESSTSIDSNRHANRSTLANRLSTAPSGDLNLSRVRSCCIECAQMNGQRHHGVGVRLRC